MERTSLLAVLFAVAAFVIASLGGVEGAAAGQACAAACAATDLRCVERRVACLITAGRAKDALKQAKLARAARPKDEWLARLVARAYLASKNTFWAQRVLGEALALRAGDCQSRAWLAWIQLREGDFDLAEETLGEGGCPRDAADRARWALLRAMMARTKKDRAGFRRHLDQASAVGSLYPEDAVLWSSLHRAAHPRSITPLRLRAELGLGFTSNINAGLPLTSSEDGASRPEESAAIGVADLHAQLVLPWWKIAPALELGLRGQYVDDFAGERETMDVRDASYLQLEARPGFYLGGDWGRAFVGYHADLFLLRGGDRYDAAGLAFFEGHRLEAELERGALTLFVGAGRRIFRQTSRSRWESDGGAGYGVSALDGRLSVLFALSLRGYFSDGDVFDAIGATVLSSLRYQLGKGFFARSTLSVGLDQYSDAPRADPLATEIGGVDFQLKARLGFWSPPWQGIRAGLRYQFSWRETELQVSFPYQDHRLLLGLRFSLTSNPWAPGAISPARHVPFPHNMQAARGAGDGEQLRDLLRQDEAAQRGSSCVN